VGFEILGEIDDVEVIAVGRRIREFTRLQRAHGLGRWRKLKGIARVRLGEGKSFLAEVHWHEAAGAGRREFKIKRIVGE